MPPISKGDHVLLNMCRDNGVMAAVHLEGHNPHTARAASAKNLCGGRARKTLSKGKEFQEDMLRQPLELLAKNLFKEPNVCGRTAWTKHAS